MQGVEEEQSTKQKTKQAAPEVSNTIQIPSTEQEKENDRIEE